SLRPVISSRAATRVRSHSAGKGAYAWGRKGLRSVARIRIESHTSGFSAGESVRRATRTITTRATIMYRVPTVLMAANDAGNPNRPSLDTSPGMEKLIATAAGLRNAGKDSP